MSCSSEFEVQIAHSVEEIGSETWDRLAAGRPFASYRWYRFGEVVLADNIPIYIILSQKNEPVARATFWLTRQEPLPIASGPIRWVIDALIRRWPLLVCRAPLAGTSGLILPGGASRDLALTAIAQAAREQAHKYRASFLVFDYLERQQIEWGGWPEDSISVTAGDPGSHLPIVWPDFEGYLRHLRKSVRKDYHRHCNRARDLGIAVCHYPIAQPLDKSALDIAIALIRNVEKRHDSAPNPWALEMLKHAGMVEATWFSAQIDHRLVGCAIAYNDGGTAYPTLLGMDYGAQYVYFSLSYAFIRYAIEERFQVLQGGSGAADLKQRLGFQQDHNNYAIFMSNNRGLRWVGRKMSTS